MVCKEDVCLWFKNDEPHTRLDLICCLLNMCLPFELHFIKTCLDDLNKRVDLRDVGNKLNNHQELESLSDISDVQIRSRIVMCVALLGATNHSGSDLLFRVLTSDSANSSAALLDDNYCREMLLLYTMVLNHPAFSFQQKTIVSELLLELQQSRSPEHQVCLPLPYLNQDATKDRNTCYEDNEPEDARGATDDEILQLPSDYPGASVGIIIPDMSATATSCRTSTLNPSPGSGAVPSDDGTQEYGGPLQSDQQQHRVHTLPYQQQEFVDMASNNFSPTQQYPPLMLEYATGAPEYGTETTAAAASYYSPSGHYSIQSPTGQPTTPSESQEECTSTVGGVPCNGLPGQKAAAVAHLMHLPTPHDMLCTRESFDEFAAQADHEGAVVLPLLSPQPTNLDHNARRKSDGDCLEDCSYSSEDGTVPTSYIYNSNLVQSELPQHHAAALGYMCNNEDGGCLFSCSHNVTAALSGRIDHCQDQRSADSPDQCSSTPYASPLQSLVTSRVASPVPCLRHVQTVAATEPDDCRPEMHKDSVLVPPASCSSGTMRPPSTASGQVDPSRQRVPEISSSPPTGALLRSLQNCFREEHRNSSSNRVTEEDYYQLPDEQVERSQSGQPSSCVHRAQNVTRWDVDNASIENSSQYASSRGRLSAPGASSYPNTKESYKQSRSFLQNSSDIRNYKVDYISCSVSSPIESPDMSSIINVSSYINCSSSVSNKHNHLVQCDTDCNVARGGVSGSGIACSLNGNLYTNDETAHCTSPLPHGCLTAVTSTISTAVAANFIDTKSTVALKPSQNGSQVGASYLTSNGHCTETGATEYSLANSIDMTNFNISQSAKCVERLVDLNCTYSADLSFMSPADTSIITSPTVTVASSTFHPTVKSTITSVSSVVDIVMNTGRPVHKKDSCVEENSKNKQGKKSAATMARCNGVESNGVIHNNSSNTNVSTQHKQVRNNRRQQSKQTLTLQKQSQQAQVNLDGEATSKITSPATQRHLQKTLDDVQSLKKNSKDKSDVNKRIAMGNCNKKLDNRGKASIIDNIKTIMNKYCKQLAGFSFGQIQAMSDSKLIQAGIEYTDLVLMRQLLADLEEENASNERPNGLTSAGVIAAAAAAVKFGGIGDNSAAPMLSSLNSCISFGDVNISTLEEDVPLCESQLKDNQVTNAVNNIITSTKRQSSHFESPRIEQSQFSQGCTEDLSPAISSAKCSIVVYHCDSGHPLIKSTSKGSVKDSYSQSNAVPEDCYFNDCQDTRTAMTNNCVNLTTDDNHLTPQVDSCTDRSVCASNILEDTNIVNNGVTTCCNGNGTIEGVIASPSSSVIVSDNTVVPFDSIPNATKRASNLSSNDDVDNCVASNCYAMQSSTDTLGECGISEPSPSINTDNSAMVTCSGDSTYPHDGQFIMASKTCYDAFPHLPPVPVDPNHQPSSSSRMCILKGPPPPIRNRLPLPPLFSSPPPNHSTVAPNTAALTAAGGSVNAPQLRVPANVSPVTSSFAKTTSPSTSCASSNGGASSTHITSAAAATATPGNSAQSHRCTPPPPPQHLSRPSAVEQHGPQQHFNGQPPQQVFFVNNGGKGSNPGNVSTTSPGSLLPLSHPSPGHHSYMPYHQLMGAPRPYFLPHHGGPRNPHALLFGTPIIQQQQPPKMGHHNNYSAGMGGSSSSSSTCSNSSSHSNARGNNRRHGTTSGINHHRGPPNNNSRYRVQHRTAGPADRSLKPGEASASTDSSPDSSQYSSPPQTPSPDQDTKTNGKRCEDDTWDRSNGGPGSGGSRGEDTTPPLPPQGHMLLPPPHHGNPLRPRYFPYPQLNFVQYQAPHHSSLLRYSVPHQHHPRFPAPHLAQPPSISDKGGSSSSREATPNSMSAITHLPPHSNHPAEHHMEANGVTSNVNSQANAMPGPFNGAASNYPVMVNAAMIAHLQGLVPPPPPLPPPSQHSSSLSNGFGGHHPNHPSLPLNYHNHPNMPHNNNIASLHPDLFFSPYSPQHYHHHHHQQHQQQHMSHTQQPPLIATLPGAPPYPNMPNKSLSCFNCGQLGHRGTECREASIEEMTKRTKVT